MMIVMPCVRTTWLLQIGRYLKLYNYVRRVRFIHFTNLQSLIVCTLTDLYCVTEKVKTFRTIKSI